MNRPLTPRATPSSRISLQDSFRSCHLLNSDGRLHNCFPLDASKSQRVVGGHLDGSGFKRWAQGGKPLEMLWRTQTMSTRSPLGGRKTPLVWGIDVAS